jgi:hypothetical protein
MRFGGKEIEVPAMFWTSMEAIVDLILNHNITSSDRPFELLQMDTRRMFSKMP